MTTRVCPVRKSFWCPSLATLSAPLAAQLTSQQLWQYVRERAQSAPRIPEAPAVRPAVPLLSNPNANNRPPRRGGFHRPYLADARRTPPATYSFQRPFLPNVQGLA